MAALCTTLTYWTHKNYINSLRRWQSRIQDIRSRRPQIQKVHCQCSRSSDELICLTSYFFKINFNIISASNRNEYQKHKNNVSGE
jgi:hypothetical protein